MIKILKVLLKKNQLTKASNDYNAQVLEKGYMNVENIVDELLNEGLVVSRGTALYIIDRFNRKSADLTLSGYSVDTGLVNLRPVIKGSLYGGNWNPNVNTVAVDISEGFELRQAIAETKVDIQIEKGDPIEMHKLSNQTDQQTDIEFVKGNSACQKKSNQKIENDYAACGIAFRTWLLKA